MLWQSPFRLRETPWRAGIELQTGVLGVLKA